ncbi:MAG: bifunctional metallophosphatase/5'-nucleotidase [Streptococcaceae bacterium]|nr:bifunctional metallophosphatase/5'-nucleotidase [Streptococcaceae bacterium]
MNNLRLLHLNDLHSHLEKFPVIERFFAEKSKENVETLRFDLGDNIDRVHPLTEATAGHINVELMNRLDLTAATVGNNEGLGLTHEMLSHLYDEANFPVLLANLETDFAISKPLIVTTSFGLRIGLIGMTAPYDLAYPSAGWKLSDPFDVLDKILPVNCDFTILLSHLGKNFDEKIAARYDIDLIIGSHTHHLFEYGAQIDKTLLAAAGKYGEHIGQIDLAFDEQNHLVDAQIETIATNTLPSRKSDAVEIHGWELRGHKLLQGTQVAELEAPLTNQSPYFAGSRYFAKIFSDYAQTEICVMNSGLLVTDLLPARLTLDDLHEFLPHSIRLVRFSFTGAELELVLTEMIDVSAFLVTQRIQGMGFRGKIFGQLIFEGIDFKNGEFLIHGEGLEHDKIYQVAMPDQYLFAWYFPLLKKLGQSEILFPYFLREIVMEYFKKKRKSRCLRK